VGREIEIAVQRARVQFFNPLAPIDQRPVPLERIGRLVVAADRAALERLLDFDDSFENAYGQLEVEVLPDLG